MLDDLANFPERFFAAQRKAALEVADWLIAQIDRIPGPARKYLPLPKSERPATYEVIEPQPGQFD